MGPPAYSKGGAQYSAFYRLQSSDYGQRSAAKQQGSKSASSTSSAISNWSLLHSSSSSSSIEIK